MMGRAIVIGYFLAVSLSAHASHIIVKTPLESTQWQVKASRLECRLTQPLSAYGHAIIHKRNGQEQSFLLTSWQSIVLPAVAQIQIRPPLWKHGNKRNIQNVKTRLGKRPVRLGRRLSDVLVTRLKQGYVARISYHNNINDRISIDLSPINFQTAYAKYMKCLGRLLNYRYQDIANHTVYYDVNQTRLTAKDKAHLYKIAQYAIADNSVKRIMIKGYSDSNGPMAVNNAISSQRAHAVKAYFLSLGLSAKRIRTTWFGERNPIVSNELPPKQNKNRRVSIKLIKT